MQGGRLGQIGWVAEMAWALKLKEQENGNCGRIRCVRRRLILTCSFWYCQKGFATSKRAQMSCLFVSVVVTVFAVGWYG